MDIRVPWELELERTRDQNGHKPKTIIQLMTGKTNYQGLEWKSAYVCGYRINWRHLPHRCLGLWLSCWWDGSAPQASSWLHGPMRRWSHRSRVGDTELATTGGLVLHQPWRGCREPSDLLFLHKTLGWFDVGASWGTYISTAVLERGKTRGKAGFLLLTSVGTGGAVRSVKHSDPH